MPRMHPDRFPPTHAARAPAAARTALHVALTAVLACATAAQAQTGPDLRRTALHCQAPLGLCLALSPDRDSDGDGYSDADERAAGTDPYDSRSQPTLPGMLNLLAAGALPSALTGRLAIVAPPTVTPDGRPLTGIGTEAYLAGRGGFVARQSSLQGLGIDPGLLASMGVAAGAGFVLRPGGGIVGAPTLVGAKGQSFSVTGMRLGKVDTPARSNPLTVVQGLNQTLRLQPGRAASIMDIVVNAQAATVRVTHPGGATTESTFNNSLIANGSSSQQTTIRDETGKVTGVRESASYATFPGSSLSVQWSAVTDNTRLRNEDGSVLSNSASLERTERPDGSETTRTDNTSLLERPDGSTVTTVTTGVSTANTLIGGSESTVTAQRIERDPSGKVVSSTTTTTTTGTDSKGNALPPKTTCTDDTTGKPCKAGTGGSANPDAAFDVVVLTPEQVARVVQIFHGANSRSGTTVLQYLTPDDVKDPSDPTPIALVDDRGVLQMMLTTPRLWNGSQGTVRTGTTGVEVPNVPPGETAQDRTLARLVSEVPPRLPVGGPALRWP